MVKFPQFWMVFFGPGQDPGALARCLPRGWQHVCCASFQGEHGLWLYVNPARDRTYVLLMTPEQFTAHFAHLLNTSTAILEFPAQDRRRFSPTWASCVGMVKGIIGIRSWAFTPHQLYLDMLRAGAESFGPDAPRGDAVVYEFDLWRRHAGSTEGRSRGGARAPEGGGAGASGSH